MFPMDHNKRHFHRCRLYYYHDEIVNELYPTHNNNKDNSRYKTKSQTFTRYTLDKLNDDNPLVNKRITRLNHTS